MDWEQKEEQSFFKDKRALTGLLIGLIVGLIIGIWMTGGADRPADDPVVNGTNDGEIENGEENDTDNEDGVENENDDENMNENNERPVTDRDESLTVSDQEAGQTVVVSHLSIADNRWVVIHEDNNGEPGNILGARFFTPDHTDGEVNLLRGTEAGGNYYAILYDVAEREEDQGRRFDRDRDLPLVHADGEMIIVEFSAL